MRSLNIFLVFIIVSLSYLLSSCSDDIVKPKVGGINTGYIPQESAECLTLASLAYVNENNSSYIRDSLIIQLANTSYATGGKWMLDWGPALTPDLSNMVYIVKDVTTDPDRYAIAIRGTDWCFPFNWEEDLGAIDFAAYPYGGTGDSVSYGALQGLNSLLTLRDSATNKTLISYLNNISATNNQMYITGHSLGGLLTTVFSAWFLDNGFGSKFHLKTYTFAAPTAGNEQFKQHYSQIFSSANAESFRVENPKDLVHYFNGELNTVITNHIPTDYPFKVGLVLTGIEAYFQSYDMVYVHVGERIALGTTNPSDCSFAPGTLDQYKCWVLYEHHPDTYLTLMGAANTNVSYVPCSW
ncbi:MAG: hypothetical protein M3P82_01965 [Bacteroidota bacterium]|nr:hypothetical protein [Bacteroidota bacterium]